MLKVLPKLALIALLLTGCNKEDNVITTLELLSAHTWVSDSYIFEGDESEDFHWDCVFNEDIPEFSYEDGDYGRLEVDMELTFREDSVYRRILFISRYVKCRTCTDFKFLEQTTDTLGAIFVAEEERLWFGSRGDPLQYFFPIEYRGRNEIVVGEFFEVSTVLNDSDCFFNESPLRDDRDYPVDFVFKPK